LDEHVLFGEFVERWLEEVAPLQYKPTGMAEYASLLRLHLLPAFGQLRLAQLSAGEVQQYLARQVESGLAPRSVRNHLAALRAVLRTAEAYGLVVSNVAAVVRPPRQHRREQRFLSPPELRALLAATSETWRSLVALPIYTGARKGEALALRWRSVSFDHHHVAFVRSLRAGAEFTVKTTASRATVPMAAELVPLLLARRDRCPDSEDGFVFCRSDGRPLDDGTPNRVIRKACARAGLEPCGYHTLRHSAIAALIATGAHPKVVQQFARHASIETTMDVYGHLMAPAGGAAVADLGRLLAGS